MDFGLVGMEDGGGDALKRHGSVKLKQERSGHSGLMLRSGENVCDSTTMLSFSSSSKYEEIPFLSVNGKDSSRAISGNVSVYALGGYGGPFTSSQWMELQHQALIYKHLVTNVPIPSSLLVSLKKSLSPYTFSGLSSRSYASNWGWGTFHLGLAGNTDPEVGRCRRTDGKKWRCSRDAVPDQKYCERHINRGRHRSRKPVESQTTGRAASGITTSSKVVPIASSSPASLISTTGASNSFGFNNNPSADHLTSNRTQGLSVISPSINLMSKESTISIQKSQNPLDASSHSEFGFLSSDSLLNLSQNSHANSKNSEKTLDFNCHATNEQHPIHHFTDNWTKELKSDWTQLSISMTTSNFSSSSSSQQEKHPLSPVRLSNELDQIQASNGIGELVPKTSNWLLPSSWGNSMVSLMGSPLGEVLNST